MSPPWTTTALDGDTASSIGADLGERRLVRLALGGHADVDEDGAVGIDAHVGALEGPDPRALDVGGEPDPEGPRRTRAGALCSSRQRA